jgi:hypothetical protein
VPICWKQRLMATASQIFPFKLTPTHDKLDKNIGNPNLRMSIMSSLIDGFFCKSIEPSSLSKLIGRRCDDNDNNNGCDSLDDRSCCDAFVLFADDICFSPGPA